MLELEPREASILKICCDARATPFLDKSFGCICAFLYDPYNTPELYKEVARLLRPGAVFIGTLPAFEWASALRKELELPLDKTRFVLRNGMTVLTTSRLSTELELREQTRSVGLEADLRLLAVPATVTQVSSDIARLCGILGSSVTSFPIIQLVVARKPK
jgi:hypothetical protein